MANFLNLFKHLKRIIKHKNLVFKFSIKAGIPLRGLVHDMSKFSPTEFLESINFYKEGISPITVARDKKGLSKAWLHHKGRNKHHVEYWYDPTAANSTPVIPYKYVVEMICDNLAASITYYNSKDWQPVYLLEYWNNVKDHRPIDDRIKKFLSVTYEEMSIKGIKPVLKPKRLKELYSIYVECDKYYNAEVEMSQN